MYFSMGKENGWALCLCKVRVSPQVASSTLRAKMRAVLRTRMQMKFIMSSELRETLWDLLQGRDKRIDESAGYSLWNTKSHPRQI